MWIAGYVLQRSPTSILHLIILDPGVIAIFFILTWAFHWLVEDQDI